ncbi:hypothetical protein M422DRAFT_55987 [Sphaerobolus stellatus SS14]|uniref:Uncharacterized protein n=1 Tax=Sphaerobolus stellatus (strain SS14) TaxID=990650 RepID=A0A0C9U8R8_SPHS4|nr:hypothetical protein M422DRAFT_55987 [Sphaerobolus stellatus SS14]
MKWHINTSLIQVNTQSQETALTVINAFQATSLQTGVTAILHTFLAITLGILLSITGSIAIDRIMRHPSGFVSDLVEAPTLGVLHLHMNAWAGLLSSFQSSWNLFRASPPEIDSHGLRRIFFYLGACALLQISSSSIFVLNLNADEPSTTLLDYFSPFILQGSRFGDFDTLWPSGIKITSSDRDVFPPAAENARRTMFAGRVNDTRYPGLQGRLIHDTTNLDNGVTQIVPWSQARVNGTLMNVHCSQISDAHISTFTLPHPSSDLSLAKPSPDGCLFQNTTDDEGVWLNFSMPAPPYWDPSAPGLNFTAYWGSNEAVALPSTLRMNY